MRRGGTTAAALSESAGKGSIGGVLGGEDGGRKAEKEAKPNAGVIKSSRANAPLYGSLSAHWPPPFLAASDLWCAGPRWCDRLAWSRRQWWLASAMRCCTSRLSCGRSTCVALCESGLAPSMRWCGNGTSVGLESLSGSGVSMYVCTRSDGSVDALPGPGDGCPASPFPPLHSTALTPLPAASPRLAQAAVGHSLRRIWLH
jgi:hypothetical protein